MPRCKICNQGNSMGNGGLKCKCSELVELVEECIFHLDVHGKKHAVKTFTERLKQITRGKE